MTRTIATVIARLIEAACNAEDHDLDETTFLALTDGLTPGERLLVVDELPAWARRQIEQPAVIA